MLRLFIEKGNHTVAELAAGLGVSIPYATKSLNELVEAQLVQEVGKRDNYSRRAPRVYDLIATSGYFLGIDTGHDRLNLGIIDFCGNMVSNEYKMIYSYEDTNECFDMLTSKINDFIDASGIDRSLIRKACMSVGGRVNPIEGKAHNYFTCLNRPLAEALTESLGIEACIDNDTRCMTYGEYLKGCCKGYRNVVFVNISWGVGIGIIIDGKMYLGKSGYSGEIGHMHIYNNGIIFYSMGNWVFGGNTNPEDKDSAIAQVRFQRDGDGVLRLLDYTLIPCSISSLPDVNDYCPTPYEEGSEEYRRAYAKISGQYDGPNSNIDYSFMHQNEEGNP